VILFPGTNPRSIRDILTDLKFRRKVIPYGNKSSKIRVHRGIRDAYISVREQIHDVVKNRVFDFKPIVIVGHSLGGGHTTLCVVDLQYHMRPGGDLYEHRRLLHWITFGAPRIGNRAFCRSFRIRCGRGSRFWGWWDVVVKLPPWLFGFRHAVEGEGFWCRHDVRSYLKHLRRGLE
jgi:predicted lipase